MDGISMDAFVEAINSMKEKYPSARVMGVGTGCRKHVWFYVVHLRYNGEEVAYEIPMYSYEY